MVSKLAHFYRRSWFDIWSFTLNVLHAADDCLIPPHELHYLELFREDFDKDIFHQNTTK